MMNMLIIFSRRPLCLQHLFFIFMFNIIIILQLRSHNFSDGFVRINETFNLLYELAILQKTMSNLMRNEN